MKSDDIIGPGDNDYGRKALANLSCNVAQFEGEVAAVSPRAFLQLIVQGCTSGNFHDWSQLRPSARWALRELDRLEGELAAMKEKYEP